MENQKTITQKMQDKNANEIIIITYENINLKWSKQD
jgi:hypothetical protein